MTTPLRDEVADAWRTLELGGGADELSVATVRLTLDAGYGPVRVARGPQGEPRLLIPTQLGRHLPEGLSSEAVAVKTVQFTIGGHPQSFIELSCLASDLHAPFRQLAEDVIRRLGDGTAPEPAVAAAIAQFRDLLRRRTLRMEAVIGLFGELHLLRELLELNPRAAQAWTGPLGQRHDFSSVHLSSEVKSTLSRDARIVHITSLEQLEPPADGRPLFLVHKVLERTGAAGATARDLIADAMRLAADSVFITQALHALELDDWRSDKLLADERFALLRQDFYHVEGNFPRVDRESFRPGFPPSGVHGITYTLDLDHAQTWRVAASDVPALIRRLADAP